MQINPRKKALKAQAAITKLIYRDNPTLRTGKILPLTGFQSWEQFSIALYGIDNSPPPEIDARIARKRLDTIDPTLEIDKRYRVNNLQWISERRRVTSTRKLTHVRRLKAGREDIERLEGVLGNLRSIYVDARYLSARKIHAIARKCLSNQATNRPIVELVIQIMAKHRYKYELKGNVSRYIDLDHENQNSSEVE